MPAPTCSALDPRRTEPREQIGREVQGRGRRSDGAVLLREHRLIIAAVGIVRGALARDIGRQRHRARAFEQQLDRLFARKEEDEAAVGQPVLGECADACAEIDRLADAQPLGVADESLPAAQVDPLVERGADAGVAPSPFELGGDDARIVEDQTVARPQPLRQVAHPGIGHRTASHHKHPRRIARARRAERNALGRQIEIEGVDAHYRDRACGRVSAGAPR